MVAPSNVVEDLATVAHNASTCPDVPLVPGQARDWPRGPCFPSPLAIAHPAPGEYQSPGGRTSNKEQHHVQSRNRIAQ